MHAEDLRQCPACGRFPAKLPVKLFVKASLIPSNVDLFRDRLFLTLGLPTERFVESVERLKLTGLSFLDVEVT
ncbi:MAG: double-CXXCG motif protein [Pyrinomonadaceae bacterium]